MCVESDNHKLSKENHKLANQHQYTQLQMSMCDASKSGSDNYGSLLLPSFIQPCGNVNIIIEGVNDSVKSVASKIVAQHYISQLTKERDNALKVARSYRDQVDGLRSSNRKLFCEMNDKIDVIRTFWRNNIAEGSTRAGRCVQMAIKKMK